MGNKDPIIPEEGTLIRDEVVADERTAIDRIQDGMTIAIGGFITTQHPMAILRGLAKRGAKGLTVIGSMSSALDVDLLVGAGCVRRLVSAYVGAESVAPIGMFFKQAAEKGEIEIWECDEIIVMALFHASAAGIPFFPVRGGLGTDLPKLNPELREFVDPVCGEKMLAVPSMKIDVAILHASQSDPFGNVQYVGNAFADELVHKAADFTITTVEKIVSPEETRRDPFKTKYAADMVVPAPFGAHPYSCQGSYVEDEKHLNEYVRASFMAAQGDDAEWKAYFTKYVATPRDHMDYLEAVGVRQLFSLNEFWTGSS